MSCKIIPFGRLHSPWKTCDIKRVIAVPQESLDSLAVGVAHSPSTCKEEKGHELKASVACVARVRLT